MFDYVASFYEDVFEDSGHVLNISFWYTNLPGSIVGNHDLISQSGGRETAADIRIDSHTPTDERNWFIDPTPEDDSEFGMFQTHWRDVSEAQREDLYNDFDSLIPAMFEVGYSGLAIEGGPAENRRDMLSTVFHEIGHALGMSGSNLSTQAETADGDYDFDPIWIAGRQLAVETADDPDNEIEDDNLDVSHLESVRAVMSTREDGVRERPSHTDLFAMAAGHNYTMLDVPRREMYVPGAWTHDPNWSGNQRPSISSLSVSLSDEAFIRHGGEAALTTVGSARSVYIDEHSTLAIRGSGRLTFDTRVAIANGALRLEVANSLSAAGGYIEVLGAGAIGDLFPEDATGRLELAAGNSASYVNEPLRLRGRSADAATAPHLYSFGSNIWNGPITLWTAGANYGFESRFGDLTLSTTATISVGNTTGSRTLRFFGESNGIANGVINEGTNTWTVVKSGPGIWTFNAANTYSGGTTIAGGTLVGATIGNSGVNSNFGRGGFTLADGGTLRYTGATASTNRNFALSGTGGRVQITTTATTLTLAGVISGSADASFGKTGNGTLRLTGANTYAGGTSVQSGTLLVGANERIPDTSTVTVFTFGTLDLNNFTETIGALAGSGTVALGTGGLTMGGNDASTTFSGFLTETGPVTKTGAGTLTFSGNNTYTGTTLVLGSGALRLEHANALGTTAGYTEIRGANDDNGRLELIGGRSYAAEPLRLRGRTAASSHNPHLLNVSGDNTWTGPISLYTAASNFIFESAAGTLTLASTAGIAVGSTTGGRELWFTGAGNGVINSVINDGNNTWRLVKRGAGTWTITTNQAYNGVTTVEAGVLQLSGAAASIASSSQIVVRDGGALRRLGGHFTHGQTLLVDDGGQVDVAAGFDLVNNGTIANGGTIVAEELRNNSVLRGSGAIVGDVFNAGTFAPGNSAGLMSIDGDFTQLAAGLFDIELGGDVAGVGFDTVSVTGGATLAGQLRLSLIDGYVPAPAATYTILNAGSVLGAFANVAPGTRLLTTDGLGSFRVDYGAGSGAPLQVVLREFLLTNRSPADFDADSLVDADDLNIWRGDFGKTVDFAADGDGDGDVDGSDFLVWQRELTGVGGPESAPVPEPSGVMLLAVACVALVWRRSRSVRG